MLHRELKLFICSSSTPIETLKSQAEPAPLVQFYEAHSQELDIHRIPLTLLTPSDITDHLKEIFSQARLPENFEKELAKVTQGNPLFLSEILRKLALDQKIPLSGQQWVIKPLEEGYLPRSLEEIVRQRIAALDEEGRQLLYQAATFGEDVSLSLLTGSSEKREAKILEFIDQAAALGLLRSDFVLNDETIRFWGKRILEATYGAIEPDQRQELHERVGHYQETLYQQRLLPSVVPLVYHFKRSANQEKAKEYEKFQEGYVQRIFNPSEADQYTGERRRQIRSELPPPGAPLDSASLAQIPNVIRCFITAVRQHKLYPAGSEAVAGANRQLKEAIDSILANNENLTIFQINQALMVNGQKIDVSEFKWITEDLLKFLIGAELKGIVFHRGLTDRELEILMEAFGRPKPKIIDRDYWHRFSAEEHLPHIELKQVRYTLMVEGEGQVKERRAAPWTLSIAPVVVSYQAMAKEQKLDQEDLIRIPEILRSLLSASKNIKLYPIESKAISAPLEQLMESLHSILSRRQALTLAQVSQALVVNGTRINVSGIETLADGFLKFLDAIALTSITFLNTLSYEELKTFIGGLGQLHTSGLTREFWIRLAQETGLSAILFDQVFYETQVTPSSALLEQEEPLEEEPEEFSGQFWKVQMAVPVSEELFETFFKEMPDRINDLLMKGDEKQIRQIMKRLFQGFQNRPFPAREKVVESCRRLLDSLKLGFQHHFSKLLADPLLIGFSEEKDSKMLREIAFPSIICPPI